MNTSTRPLFFIVSLLTLLFFAQCSSSDAPNIPAVGENFCMDIDADSFSGYYIRSAEDSDASMQALTFLTCDETTYDCNDSNSAIFPGAVEITANGIDENCDNVDASVGLTTGDDDTEGDDDDDTGTTCSDGSAQITYYLDSDGDGYGVSTTTQLACERPSGYSTLSTDCNDSNSDVHPGATERLEDEVDQDCDGGTETAVCDSPKTYFLDADGDGYYGDTSISSCFRPADNYYTNVSGDPYYAESENTTTACGSDGDSNKYKNPGMSGKDYGYLVYQIDPNSAKWIPLAIKQQLLAAVPQFTNPASYITNASAYNVTNTGVYLGIVSTFTNELGLPEPIEGEGIITAKFLNVDNDCDGDMDEDASNASYDNHAQDPIAKDLISDYNETSGIYFNACEGLGAFTFFEDSDHDDYGNENGDKVYDCRNATHINYVTNSTDCDDGNDAAYPGHDQSGDGVADDYSNYDGVTDQHSGVDNDCDGSVDENYAHELADWTVTAAFAGLCFDNTSDKNSSEIGGFSSQILSEYLQADSNTQNSIAEKPSAMGFVASSNISFAKDIYYSKIYANAIRANKTYAQFWHNYVNLNSNYSDGSPVYDDSKGSSITFSDVSCNHSNNSCEGDMIINLTTPDATDDATDDDTDITADFLKDKRAAIFLRGVQFYGVDDTLKDAQMEVSISDTRIVYGAIIAHFSTNFNGVKSYEEDSKTKLYTYTSRIPFTIMVYDPKYIQVVTSEITKEGYENTSDNNKYINQTEDIDFSSLYKVTQPSNFDCQDESDCKEQTKTVGTVLYSWGFNYDSDSTQLDKLKGMSYARQWANVDSTNSKLVVKSKGVAYDASTATELPPNRMGSQTIICANSSVCSMALSWFEYTKEKESVSVYQDDYKIVNF